MNYESETPFDSIESAHQYVDLLIQAIEEARVDVDADIAATLGTREERRVQALQLVCYKLNKLSTQMTSSRRILNDLRTLRRLLLQEREVEVGTNDNSRS
ncbi:MAG: hypothetical protein ACRD7E_11460 [Bryobacteraceae bacterium]